MDQPLKTRLRLFYAAVVWVAMPSLGVTADPKGGSAAGGEPNAKTVVVEMAAAEVAVGKVLFSRKCAKCHAADEPVNDIGPSLYQVVGRRAGTLPDYDYSSSIRSSGLVWTEENLLKYINDPHALLPCRKIQIRALSMCSGIHMKFQGFKNPYAAKAVVAYLKSHGVSGDRDKN